MASGTIDRIERALIIAPHPDDEVLGCGGTIARLVQAGKDVQIVIATTGFPHITDQTGLDSIRREAAAAHAILGVTKTHYLDLPAARVDTVPRADINAKIGAVVSAAKPDTLFLPHYGDIHHDHQLIFTAAMVAARPAQAQYPVRIWAYETLSETNWNAPQAATPFIPNVFVEIGDTLERKLAAMQAYKSQVRAFPQERSVEALRALAALRGATVHRTAAEAFSLIRDVT